jgi:glycerol-3-phosphate acyltransferase PlsX
LKNSYLSKSFIGFVEGNEITNGVADVVVADGFSGNISLKTAEGIAKLCAIYIKKMFAETFLGKIAYLLIRNSLNSLKSKLDPRNRNGALFLGLNGIVVKSHGGADDLSFAAAIDIAFEFSKEGVGDKIIGGLKSFNEKGMIID